MELLNIYDPSVIEQKPFALYQEWVRYITQKDEMNAEPNGTTNLLEGGSSSLIQGLT